LDTQSYLRASQKYFGAAAPNMSVLQAFLQTNPYVKNVDQWHKLDLADAAGTGPRAVCYQRTNEVCEMDIPVMFETFAPQFKGLSMITPCHARMGGVVFYYPLGAAYMDGL